MIITIQFDSTTDSPSMLQSVLDLLRSTDKQVDFPSDRERATAEKAAQDLATQKKPRRAAKMTVVPEPEPDPEPEPEPEPEPKAAKTKAVKQPEPVEESGISRSDMIAHVTHLLGSGGREQVMAALTEVGASRVSEVPDSKIDAFMAALDE